MPILVELDFLLKMGGKRLLNFLAWNSFIRYKVTRHSKTLIDKIFYNIISFEVICGNITATISSHLHQFSFYPNVLSEASRQKSYIYEIDWSKFIQADFVFHYLDKDWSDVL